MIEDMIEKKDEKRVIILLIVDLLLIIANTVLVIQIFTFNPCPPYRRLILVWNVTKTANGWRLTGEGGIYIDKNVVDNLHLSSLHYFLINSSGVQYENGTMRYIKDHPSPYGLVFYDRDKNEILSNGDYLIVYKHYNKDGHPESGDVIIFSYSGAAGSVEVRLP